MKAPKCKVCGKEHWGVCYTPAAEVKERVAAIEKRPASVKARTKMAANVQAARNKPAAKKTTKPKARKAK